MKTQVGMAVNYVQSGDSFSGFQKSLSKKSEYFFSELDVQITDVDSEKGLISGLIDKKVISIGGKKHLMKVFFEGYIIDGVNHTFTSKLSASCEALDVYFWNRFTSIKDLDSLKGLKDHSSRYIYMRWTEKGVLKTKRMKTEKKVNSPGKKELKEEVLVSDESEDEDDFELIEYFDSRPTSTIASTSGSSGSESQQDNLDTELNANGQYFICYDVVQNKITGYFKQDFMKNCQKLILQSKAEGSCGNTFAIGEKM